MAKAVLDASALLAVINAEAGAAVVAEALDDAIISAVNYAEVITKLVERGMTLEAARSAALGIGVDVISFDIDLAHRTGELRRQTKRLGLSLADRACLALAEREGAPALTGDRKWTAIGLDLDVRLIR